MLRLLRPDIFYFELLRRPQGGALLNYNQLKKQKRPLPYTDSGPLEVINFCLPHYQRGTYILYYIGLFFVAKTKPGPQILQQYHSP